VKADKDALKELAEGAPEPDAPAAAPPKKRGRRSKAELEAARAGEVDVQGETLADIYRLLYGTLAKRVGDEWVLDDAEAGELGKATASVLLSAGETLTPVQKLLLVAAVVNVPRIAVTVERRYRTKPKPEAQPKSPPAGLVEPIHPEDAEATRILSQ